MPTSRVTSHENSMDLIAASGLASNVSFDTMAPAHSSPSDPMIEAPIQERYFLSGGAWTLGAEGRYVALLSSNRADVPQFDDDAFSRVVVLGTAVLADVG